MAPHIHHDGNPTVVAVDRDKHSTSAVRWAIEHLLVTNTTIILVHVRTRNLHNHGSNGGAPEANDESIEDIFTHFRAYCARKRIVMQVVVLDGIDVHSTLLDYINSHHITNIVLGASSRSPITRKFWTHDVPTMINKAAPDFCTVYVIAKGKAQSVRPAARHAASSTPPRLPSPLRAPVKNNHAEPEDGCRAPPAKGHWKTASSELIKPEISLTDGSMDYHHEISSTVSKTSSSDGHEMPNWWPKSSSCDWTEVSSREPRHSSSCNSQDTDSAESGINLGSMDIAMGETADHEGNLSSSVSIKTTLVLTDKANLKSTAYLMLEHLHMNLERNLATFLMYRKLDELHRLEQARLAEEAALALVEVEKAKCRAAIEAAEKAQRIAKKETQRRKHAELKAKQETVEKNRALTILSNNDVRYRKYTIEEIEAATNKFSRSMKIGEGGYGPVFKGKLDHTRVAIKVLRPDAAQGRKQFQQEVEVLSFMRHPNMVLLMGACPEYGCLVYEYMNNGSLEDRLFRKGNTPPIPWGIRFKIAADIATGLLFLHQAKPEPLVHRDLKPANILLDRHYTCKISDVGLARLVPPSVADSVTQYHMTSAAGTFCYIDPEYQQTGKLGTKSDIYSLGVMLLQIITARPPMGLTHQVEKAMEKGTFADLLDPTVPHWPVEEALGYAKLALKCAELRKKDRPDLAKVILPELNKLKELGMEHILSHKNSSHISSPRQMFFALPSLYLLTNSTIKSWKCKCQLHSA
ncbi:hypothetical protein Pfo_010823 [Paulownia fortunei]|nr:hypothetical protein Pfo_010823 [Paulownia fortunei]